MKLQQSLESIADALGDAVEHGAELQKRYDKMVDDIIIIAAELGAPANYASVIERIKELRAIERTHTAREAEAKAHADMLNRMYEAQGRPPADSTEDVP